MTLLACLIYFIVKKVRARKERNKNAISERKQRIENEENSFTVGTEEDTDEDEPDNEYPLITKQELQKSQIV